MKCQMEFQKKSLQIQSTNCVYFEVCLRFHFVDFFGAFFAYLSFNFFRSRKRFLSNQRWAKFMSHKYSVIYFIKKWLFLAKVLWAYFIKVAFSEKSSRNSVNLRCHTVFSQMIFCFDFDVKNFSQWNAFIF